MGTMNKTIRLWLYEKRLRREQAKLDRLIGATMDEPIALNPDILTQSRRVDALVQRLQEQRKGDTP